MRRFWGWGGKIENDVGGFAKTFVFFDPLIVRVGGQYHGAKVLSYG